MRVPAQPDPQQEDNLEVSGAVSADALVHLLREAAGLVLAEAAGDEGDGGDAVLQDGLQPQPPHPNLPEKVHLLSE